MNVIVITNQNGGVAKTTSSLNISHGLANKGFRVLSIDTDAQSHLSLACGIQYKELNFKSFDVNDPSTYEKASLEGKDEPSILELLEADDNFQEVLEHSRKRIADRFDLIPSNPRLGLYASVNLPQKMDRERRLKSFLDGIDENQYDFVVIDSPPSFGIVGINNLVAAHHVIIPVELDAFSMFGMRDMFDTIGKVHKKLNQDLQLLGIVAVKVRPTELLARKFAKLYDQNFDNKYFASYVRHNIAISKAVALKQSIFDFDIHSNGAHDYMRVVNEIIEKVNQ
jgi:chromosome partitioning protein